MKEQQGFKEVPEVEFWTFVNGYPIKLEWDVCNVYDPPMGTYNDFRLGVWPASNVARVVIEYPDRGPKRYYIPDGWEPAKMALRLKPGTRVNIPQCIHAVTIVVCGDEWMIVRALAQGRNGFEEIPVLVGSATVCNVQEPIDKNGIEMA